MATPRISVMAMVRKSMDISIARLHGGRELARAKPVANRLQRAARRELRVTPRVGVLADALARDRSRLGAIGFQTVEPRAVDGLERQLELKALLGRGVQLARF